MKLSYFIPAFLVTVCVACPGRLLTEEQRASVKNPHESKSDFKFRFVDEKTEAEFHEKSRKLNELKGHAKTGQSYQAITVPSCQSTNGATVVSSKANTCAAYNIVQPQFASAISNLNGDVYWLSTVYGALVRLAFHDAGEVDITSSDNYGPDGCLSSSSKNAGLYEDSSLIYQGVEPLWQQVCDKITRADFWVMMAKLALESAEPTGTMTIDYQYGRKDIDDSVTSCPDNGRLPGGESDVDDMYQLFVTRMGMTLNDASTLLGAHTLGHMHTGNSGYGLTSDDSDGYTNGFDDTPHVFDNNYFYNMLVNTWTSQAAPAQPNTLVQFQTSQFPSVVVLPADISQGYIRTSYSSFIAQSCGPYAVPVYSSTTSGSGSSTTKVTGYTYGCTPSNTIMPLTCWQSCNHGNSNSYFLSEFRTAFSKMTCAGYGVPATTTGASASGKLGTLYYLDLNTC